MSTNPEGSVPRTERRTWDDLDEREMCILTMYRSADAISKWMIQSVFAWFATLQEDREHWPSYSPELVREVYAECWEYMDEEHRETACESIRRALEGKEER